MTGFLISPHKCIYVDMDMVRQKDGGTEGWVGRKKASLVGR